MNFFKSILSDEDPQRQTDTTTNSPSSASRAAAWTSTDQQTGTRAASSGAWSFGDLVKTITTRSESVIETYRRDLAEFGSGLRKESDLFREAANNAVKVIIPEPSKNSKLESVGNYSRFDSQLNSIQNDIRTYIDDPDDDEFDKWKLGFVLGEKRGEIAEILKNEKVDAIFREVVGGGEVDEVSFWCRYFYKVRKMREVEDVRSKFVMRALEGDDEEELSWDVDDDKEENVVRENDKKPSLDYKRENVSSSVIDDDDDNNERKLSENVSSSVVDDEEIVKTVGGDVSDKKVELVESVRETDEGGVPRVEKDNVDEVKPSGNVSDEKVELVTKTDDKEKLQVDEDLEWDEIGDIGENDDKHVTQGGSLKKDEVLKRLNSGDEDEDLSWDIEDDDDDEPVKTGNSK
ncbi:BSD domain-containing protein 1-like protein [Tanacetum coccineum]